MGYFLLAPTGISFHVFSRAAPGEACVAGEEGLFEEERKTKWNQRTGLRSHSSIALSVSVYVPVKFW